MLARHFHPLAGPIQTFEPVRSAPLSVISGRPWIASVWHRCFAIQFCRMLPAPALDFPPIPKSARGARSNSHFHLGAYYLYGNSVPTRYSNSAWSPSRRNHRVVPGVVRAEPGLPARCSPRDGCLTPRPSVIVVVGGGGGLVGGLANFLGFCLESAWFIRVFCVQPSLHCLNAARSPI